MINASNYWDVIEDAYQNLGATDDDAIDPTTLEDYDYDTANEETAYQITNAQSPEIAELAAYARAGYLDDDNEIWEAIGAACRRALEKVAEERWQEYQDENEDDEDWNE